MTFNEYLIVITMLFVITSLFVSLWWLTQAVIQLERNVAKLLNKGEASNNESY